MKQADNAKMPKIKKAWPAVSDPQLILVRANYNQVRGREENDN
jgi:hypothetical protein